MSRTMKEDYQRKDEKHSAASEEIESDSPAMMVNGEAPLTEKENSRVSPASASPSRSRTTRVSGVCTPEKKDSGKTLLRRQRCNNEGRNGGSDLSSKRYPSYGEFLILYGSHECVLPVTLRRGGVLNTRLGNYRHEDIISTPYGSKVWTRKTDLKLVLDVIDISSAPFFVRLFVR